MTRVEIIKAAIARQKHEKIPYFINLTTEGYRAYGDRLIADYGNDKIKSDYANGKLNLNEAVSLSVGNFAIYTYAPWWKWHNLPDYFLNEWDTPEHMPDTIGTGCYEDYFEHVKYLKENYDVYVIATIWGSHWEKAYFARGIENFLADLAGSPEWSQELLDLIIRKNIVMLENILTCENVDGVLLGSDWGSQNDLIMSPDTWRTMIKDGEKQEYDLIKKYGKDVWVHSCGNIERIMGDLVELGVDVLNPIQPECMDIGKLSENYGDKITFYGGISTQQTLPYGNPDEVRSETLRVADVLNCNNGYILAPSQEIQTDVSYENLRALIDTAIECAEF